MNRHALWAGGLFLLIGSGPVAAQPGTTGAAKGTTTPIPRSTKSFTPHAGAKAGSGGVNLSTPIPKAGAAPAGRGTAFGGLGGAKSGAGGPGTGGAMTGGGGFGGGPRGTPLSTGDEIALLAEARLLVTRLEATGNLPLDRRGSMLLTLLVYEALRQQAGAGDAAAPLTAPAAAP